jgi:hypothetical protein
MKPEKPSEKQNVELELDARACEHAVWIGLRMAQRAGWADLVNSLTLVHAAASDRRRTLEAISR